MSENFEQKLLEKIKSIISENIADVKITNEDNIYKLEIIENITNKSIRLSIPNDIFKSNIFMESMSDDVEDIIIESIVNILISYQEDIRKEMKRI